MDTIIGLGQTGCNIAGAFAQHKQYKIYKIDHGLDGFRQDGNYKMPWQDSPERYEKNCPDLNKFFKDVDGEILFIVGGAGNISGASLSVLEHLQHCDINVLYIRPEIESLGAVKAKQEWAAFNILQEYARSGVFKRIYLVSNPYVEEHIGNIPVIGYFDKINEMIVSCLHMINVYNHNESVIDTFFDPMDVCRISTIGFYNEETNENRLLFPLDNIREMRYYYAINKEKLENDGEVMKKIREQTRDKIKTCYGVYATNYEQDYVYTVAHTSLIQQQKK